MISTGQVLNDTYEITERLGSGAGGIIFKAYHRRMRKYVAVKLIKEEIKESLDNRSEVDVLKNLKHEYLPQVLDFVEDGNDVYTVMEFIEGQNFKQHITSGRRFDEKSVRKYALQLCKAVEYLHSHQPPIIHSDIKPANIMLTPQDNICLIDFNISMMTNNGAAAAVGGSRGFAAPEQFKQIINAPTEVDEFHEKTRFVDNDNTEILLDTMQTSSGHVSLIQTKNRTRAFIDIRTDIYGIGASIYYMLTARIPAGGQLDFRGINCSTVIKEVIAKAMVSDPSKRYRNAADMKKALQSRINVRMLTVPAVVICVAALCVGVALSGVPDRIASTTEQSRTGEITDSLTETTPVEHIQTTSAIEAFTVTETTSEASQAAEPQPKEFITINDISEVTTAETTAADTTTATTTTASVEGFISIKGRWYPTSLTELDLFAMNLTDEDIKPLSKMVNLTSLNLTTNQISDISPLSGLTNLTYLDLSRNQISDISSLSGLTNLASLNLTTNQISDINPLSGLTNLTYLDLSLNQISDVSALQGLNDLEYLDLCNNQIRNIDPIKGLTNWDLNLHLEANQISESDIEELRKTLPNCFLFY